MAKPRKSHPLRPIHSKRAWPKIKYANRHGISREQHEAVLKFTPKKEYRIYFELLWHTGGSQTDIASLHAEDINWGTRRLYYERQKLRSKGQCNACLVIGKALEAILLQFPKEDPSSPTSGRSRKASAATAFGPGGSRPDSPRESSSTPLASPGLRGPTPQACQSAKPWPT